MYDAMRDHASEPARRGGSDAGNLVVRRAAFERRGRLRHALWRPARTSTCAGASSECGGTLVNTPGDGQRALRRPGDARRALSAASCGAGATTCASACAGPLVWRDLPSVVVPLLWLADRCARRRRAPGCRSPGVIGDRGVRRCARGVGGIRCARGEHDPAAPSFAAGLRWVQALAVALVYDMARAPVARRAGHAIAPGRRREVVSTSAPVHVLEFRMVRGTGGGPEKTILLGAAPGRPRADTRHGLLPARRERRRLLDRRARQGTRASTTSRSSSATRWDPATIGALTRLIAERRASTSSTRTTTRPTCSTWLAARRRPASGRSRRRTDGPGTAPGNATCTTRRQARCSPGFRSCIAVSERNQARADCARREPRPRTDAAERDRPGRVPDDSAPVRAGGPARFGLSAGCVRASARSGGSSRRNGSTCSSTHSPTSSDGTRTLRLLIAGEGSARAALEAPDRRAWSSADRCRLAGQQSDIARVPSRARPVRAVVRVRGHAQCRARGHGARDARGGHRRRRHARVVRGWRPRHDRAGRRCGRPGRRHRGAHRRSRRRGAHWPAQRVDMWNGISRSRSA